MLASLRDGVLAAVAGVRSEVEQVSKLSSASPGPALLSSPLPSSSSSSYRSELLELAQARREFAERVKAVEHDAQLKVAALELQVSSLRSENERLRWEPRKARDGLVLLCVSLSIAFTLVCFALFAMAERQLGPHKSWEDHVTGSVLLLLGSVLLVGAVPLTHLSGEYLYGTVGFRFYQPLAGGGTYVLLQFFAWACYALFLALALWAAFEAERTHGLVTAAGALGVVAQVVMVSSLLSFRPEQRELERAVARSDAGLGLGTASAAASGYSSDGSMSAYNSEDDSGTPEHAAKPPLLRRASSGSRARKGSVASSGGASEPEEGQEFDLWLDADFSWNSSYSAFRMDTDTALFAAFMGLQSSLVVVSLALGFIAERAAIDRGHRVLAGALALALLVTAAVLTHGLGGSLSHRVSWKALQPFAGGTQYLLLQGIVWSVFGLCVASQASFLGLPVYLTTQIAQQSGLDLSMTKAGALALGGHLLLVYSISSYRGHAGAAAAAAAAAAATAAGVSPALKQAAAHHRFEQVRDPVLLERLAARMARYRGLRSALGTVCIVVLCNTHWCIFLFWYLFFYAPFPLLCAVGPEQGCAPQPDDTFAAFAKFSLCICVFTVGYSIMKIFNIRGAVRIVTLIMLTLLPVAVTLYTHRDSGIAPLLRVVCLAFVAYNYRTYSGMPELTGCREWKAFRDWRWIWDVFEDYQGAELVTDAKLDAFEQADGGHTVGSPGSKVKNLIACYAPHGIFPTTVIWLPNATMFRNRFPGLTLTSMTASIIHLTPFMRDVAQWAGVRDVGRESVERALRKGESPMLVVGGQGEMFLSKSWVTNIDVLRSHKGFVRMAIMYGTPLLPVFSFGEHKTMDNLYMPRMQNWFKQRFGFPVPYLPYGRWFLPVNRRTPLTICVGAPVFPAGPPTPKPTNAEIDELHERYYKALEDMFERNKARCGFPDAAISWAGADEKKKHR